MYPYRSVFMRSGSAVRFNFLNAAELKKQNYIIDAARPFVPRTIKKKQ